MKERDLSIIILFVLQEKNERLNSINKGYYKVICREK